MNNRDYGDEHLEQDVQGEHTESKLMAVSFARYLKALDDDDLTLALKQALQILDILKKEEANEEHD